MKKLQPNNKFYIEDKLISIEQPTYFIADIAANHDGDLELAKDLIYLAADSGADAAKFQHFKADTIVSDKGFKDLGNKSSHQSSWKKSVYEIYKDASINLDWTNTLKETCKKAGISFFTSPYSLELVDFIDKYIPAYKIGSGDITWIEIIEHISKKNKPYIIATGASSYDEVIKAVETGIKYNQDIALLQCNTNYTGSKENFKYINLNVLNTFKNIYPSMILGLSDHTPGHSTVLGAIALGARIIEKHFTDDKSREGPDHKFSMTPESWREMVNRSREIEFSLGSGIKKIEENELETVVLQRRAIRINKDLSEGSILKKDILDVLRPCPIDAISPSCINDVLGRKIKNNLIKGDYLKWKDII